MRCNIYSRWSIRPDSEFIIVDEKDRSVLCTEYQAIADKVVLDHNTALDRAKEGFIHVRARLNTH